MATKHNPIAVALLALAAACSASAAEPVTVENFVRAESDYMLQQNMKMMGVEIGELKHLREPTSPDNQPVIRMNVDTLYSAAILDLSKPVTATLADIGGRYQSMHVVNQDHYMLVEDSPGVYELTEDSVGTRFALVTFRTFANPNDAEDLKAAHAAQDAIELKGGGQGPLETPDWDLEALGKARRALSDLAVLGFDASYAFGSPEDTRPIDHLVGAASGWGGLPRAAASYTIGSVKDNDGSTPYLLNVADVPVDAFWSVTVYNAQGYLEANERNIYSYNNITAEPNPGGSFTLHFGRCDDGRLNCIPVTPGWNYAMRMYAPQEAILSGEWTFPEPEPITGP